MGIEVAKTIAKQIGGKALFMMGAKSLTGSEESLTFKVGRGAKGPKGSVTHIKITLEPTDTYTLEAFFVRGTTFKTRAKVEGAYAEMIHPFLKAETGMALSLGI